MGGDMRLRNKETGEIVEVNALGLVFNRYNQPFDLGKYASIKELIEEWEDYEPAEPLIKDEKIRKAVRAWAEANKITNIYCYQYERTCEFDCENLDLDCYATIRFIGDDIIDKRHNNDTYTITELCGEEE
jgi:hypothetical protein